MMSLQPFAVLLLAASVAPSPAERRIAAAQALTEREAARPGAWAELAFAFASRARETSDPAFYVRGLTAVEHALALDPEDFEAGKAKAWLLLGQHRFAEALDVAQRLNARAPDDVLVYGLLTDASVELGRYAEAERSCQWMLDLRPANVPGLTRAAYLRELFGDLEGSRQLMQQALEQTAPGETEERAWLLTQIGHLRLGLGQAEQAETALQEALESFPGYHYALGQLARVRGAQGRHAEAASLQAERYAQAPHPENLFELAEALERAGRRPEAREAFARFERAARAEMGGADNANRELVFYYADHAGNPKEALRVSELESARRADAFTQDAHAWALWRNGRKDEARRTLQAALAVGTRDQRLREHARVMGLPVQAASR